IPLGSRTGCGGGGGETSAGVEVSVDGACGSVDCVDEEEKRKEMIRNVQKVIGKLESKVPGTPGFEQNSNPMKTETTSTN
ncbi:unnamed protein product, partial [Didymodactylos carnosus]